MLLLPFTWPSTHIRIYVHVLHVDIHVPAYPSRSSCWFGVCTTGGRAVFSSNLLIYTGHPRVSPKKTQQDTRNPLRASRRTESELVT